MTFQPEAGALHSTMHRLSFLALTAALSTLPFRSYAQQPGRCPDGATEVAIKRSVAASKRTDTSKLPIELNSESGDAGLDGTIEMRKAEARQGDRTLSADALTYDTTSQALKARGMVVFEDPQLQISSATARSQPETGVEFEDATFMLKAQAGHGSADRIQVDPQGNVALSQVNYTSCPPGSSGWLLELSDLRIDQATNTGSGRDVKLEFMDVPIFYLPRLSFPVGNERKTGVLFPTLNGSSRGGEAIALPWYWNIAPNYDATLTSIIDTARGFRLDSEFRYLTEHSKGTVLADYLPYDSKYQAWRGHGEIENRTDFNDTLRLDIHAAGVSDRQWFEDFGRGRDATSTLFLPREGKLDAQSDNWQSTLYAQNLQVLDETILTDCWSAASGGTEPCIRPYSILPRLSVRGGEHALPYGVDFNFEGELTRFSRNQGVTGARLHLAPELSMPLRAPGMYLEPSMGWRFTTYELQRNDFDGSAADFNSNPRISAPVYSVDTGLIFERPSGRRHQRVLTLEPRLLYTYVPYREQSSETDAWPLFDTAAPDFNLVQLFSKDRYVGADRLGDRNQMSVGVTTRMLDADNGSQFLSATLGQTFYFERQQFHLSDETDNSSHSSDIIGLLSLSGYKYWNAYMGVQWDPTENHSERAYVGMQYLPGRNRVANLAYRYSRDTVDQYEGSLAWPVHQDWSVYGRAVYSSLDSKFLEYSSGFEYRSCCWNVRLVLGRSVATRTGEFDTSYGFQFELKGLSSVGSADAFLKGSIPGYSAGP